MFQQDLYAQANNLDDVNIVLSALKEMGFDDVFEVSAAAEVVSLLSRRYIEENKDKWPIISTACPSVVRLIRVRFPNLVEHMIGAIPDQERDQYCRTSPRICTVFSLSCLQDPRLQIFFGSTLGTSICLPGNNFLIFHTISLNLRCGQRQLLSILRLSGIQRVPHPQGSA